MDIQQAIGQVEGAVRAYVAKDGRGLPLIPTHMQRPVFLYGPPGVGKTAIVAQVASELGINLVSYSITHHTRQSALGLPMIVHNTFDGVEYGVSEYTMSEIIADVYRAREESGVAEGILFLDEVNCVSETLAPAMLQFLQYKVFGTHRLPEGWAVVCAGNPPEYNRSAREFDPATLDRLKRVEVQPELNVWQGYAASHGVHPAVTTFLEAKPENFYLCKRSPAGMRLVTPRGWEDLSRMLRAYESLGISANKELVRQYLQDDGIARDFWSYYELFHKYEKDYKVADILAGKADGEVQERARKARFDERVALVGLMLDVCLAKAHDAVELEEALREARKDVTLLKARLQAGGGAAAIDSRIAEVASSPDVAARPKGSCGNREVVRAERLRVLRLCADACAKAGVAGRTDSFPEVKEAFNAVCKQQKSLATGVSHTVNNAFVFLDGTYGAQSQESLILTTKLAADPAFVKTTAMYGCEGYMRHNKDLLLTERNLSLKGEVEALLGEAEL